LKTPLLLAAAVFALLAAGCNPIYVNYDYDKDADFTQYQSYSWMELPESTPQDAAQAQKSSPLVVKKLRGYIDAQLAAKRLSKVEQGGDYLVIYYLDPKQMLFVQQTAYSGMDIWANSRMGGSTTQKEITEGTMIVDLIDSKTNQLVWRGMAENAHESDASMEQLYDTAEKAIAKIFENYPPPK